MSSKIKLLIFCLLLAFDAGAAKKEKTLEVADPTLKSLCRDDESAALNCVITGSGRVLSLCQSDDFNRTQGHLQFRFGKNNTVEFEYPKNRTASQRQFTFSRETRPGVALLRTDWVFEGAKYEIYQDAVSEPGQKYNESGLRVTSKTGKTTTFKCTKNSVLGSLMALEAFLPSAE